MSAPTRIAIAGAAGRMGRTVIKALKDRQDAVLVAALEREGADCIGAPAAEGVPYSIELPDAEIGALIDFSSPAAVAGGAAAAVGANAAYIACVTGLGDEQQKAIDDAAAAVPVVQAGNTSLGVAVLSSLVERAARALGADYDIEIVETHHRRKVDAPSGTALLLGDAAADGRGLSRAGVRKKANADRSGARDPGSIGFAVMRGGGVYGEHAVRLIGDREEVTLSHRALDRGLFADGAIAAALWAVGREPGLYGMKDVLGLADRSARA